MFLTDLSYNIKKRSSTVINTTLWLLHWNFMVMVVVVFFVVVVVVVVVIEVVDGGSVVWYHVWCLFGWFSNLKRSDDKQTDRQTDINISRSAFAAEMYNKPNQVSS